MNIQVEEMHKEKYRRRGAECPYVLELPQAHHPLSTAVLFLFIWKLSEPHSSRNYHGGFIT